MMGQNGHHRASTDPFSAEHTVQHGERVTLHNIR